MKINLNFKRWKNEGTNSQAEDQIPTSNLSRINFMNSSANGLL